MTSATLQRIWPTAHAPYAARFIDDDYAVEYRYSLAEGVFEWTLRLRIHTDGPYVEQTVGRGHTDYRHLPGEDVLRDHAWEVIVEFTG